MVREESGSRSAEVHVRVRSLEASARVVESATGKRPSLDDAAAEGRLAALRSSRVRKQAASDSKWNAALNGLAEQAAKRPSARGELENLLESAGFAHEIYDSSWLDAVILSNSVGTKMPTSITNYSQWTVEEVTQVSKHSALFRLTSSDRKRGTPHPRGGGRMASPVTWHTTLLAEVGPNSEGPLPWVERDYTPVSCAREWDAGRCELLVKVYPDGAATGWLQRAAPSRIWLSKPARTLHVPGLVAEGGAAFNPASVLLLLAGTGVVALPQILAHRDPANLLGISTPRRSQLRVPIDMVLSCREDDVLLLSQIAQWCKDGGVLGLRRCTLLITPRRVHDAAAPFPDAPAAGVAEAERALRGIENARVVRSRVDSAIVAEAHGQMVQPCRYVVSGPGEYNAAVREMLARLVSNEDGITVLSA